MGIWAWVKGLAAHGEVAPPAVSGFPVAVFWRSICSSKQPVLLVKSGLQVLAATEEAYDLFGGRALPEIADTFKQGIDPASLALIEATLANPCGQLADLPFQVESVDGNISATVTVSALPEYPEQNAALLFFKDNRNSTFPLWTHASSDLLSRIPLPAWLVDEGGGMVFSNNAFSQFPLKMIQAEVAAHGGSAEHELFIKDARLLLSDLNLAPEAVRAGSKLMQNSYNLGPYGKWRIVHFPLKCPSGKCVVGALAMWLDALPAVNGGEYRNSSELIALMGPGALSHVLQVKEAERTALAREIHDSLGQELTVLKLELRRLDKVVDSHDSGSVTVKEHFQSVRKLVDEVAKTARRIAYDLRNDLAGVHGLANSVQEFVVDLRERMGLPIQLEIMPGWVEPEQGMAHHLRRSLQEMLNNVSKHAQASRCLVRMGLTDTTYWLEVRDDGVGLQLERPTQSIGLRSLRERAAIHGGQLVIKTRPEVAGTVMRIEMKERRVVTQSRQGRVVAPRRQEAIAA